MKTFLKTNPLQPCGDTNSRRDFSAHYGYPHIKHGSNASAVTPFDAGVTVSAGKSLTLEAKNSITLKAGTSIQAGAVFSAKISDIALCCPVFGLRPTIQGRAAGAEAEPVSAPSELHAWPNPANGQVTVAAPDGHTLTAVQLIDMQGRISVIAVPENAAEISLTLPDVGLYIVRACYEDGSWHTTKIVSVSTH